ncbi:hypothetical protein [Paracoccus marcusii]|uniref:Uncharacterized protein n=1 Tax=Paracoccus marcusii TaxID=59779 RepID=A0ABY7UU28_9RHOB|nr:hypothetical protein [Paracoccus marcusii]WDA13442.1 hypothetical protein PRL19_04100 [Paracoccus marcusii]
MDREISVGCHMRMIILAAVLVSATPAWTQELRSINETMQSIDDDLHVSAYTSVRCAGLFDGILAYGGQNMPAELVERYQNASTTLVIGTTIIRAYQTRDRGLPAKDFEVEFRNSDAEAVRFRDIYSDRLQNNYNLTGQMLEADPLAKADLALCGEVAPRIEKIVAREMERAAD